MTWIRWETGAPRHELIGTLADALHIHTMQALGHYNSVLCGFGDHQKDGDAGRVTDTTLEQWAQWRGMKGRFAAVFREHCLERREQERDPPGHVKGWWRQLKLLERQKADAERRKPPKTPYEPSREPATDRLGNPQQSRNGIEEHEDEDGNGNELLASSARATLPDFRTRCTVACNRGLRENANIQGFNELVTSNQDEPEKWFDAGIPLAFCEQIIYERSLSYKPTAGSRQPTTLRYFTGAIREAWERKKMQSHEAAYTPVEDERLKGPRHAAK